MSSKYYPDYPVLIVDDEEHVVASQEDVLKSHGIANLISTTDSREVAGILRGNEVELVLLDLRMPHVQGEEILALVRDEYPQVPVIVVTGSAEIEVAVQCMRGGAIDYMVKPVEENRLVSGVKRAIELRELKREYSDLRSRLLSDRLNNPEAFSYIITQDRKMHSIFLYLESIAGTD
jgi:DNA-binding NtrC family response regulator